MKILILCDHYPLSPRVKKIRNSLIKLYPNCIVKVFAWNRSNNNVVEDYVISFNQEIGYGKKLNKLFNLFKFIKSAKEFMNGFKPDYIHSIDIEMLITSALISKKTKLIYEIYDIKFFKNNFINWIREKIEFFMINRYTYAMILASPYFDIYYKEKRIKCIKMIVINNKPSNELNVETKGNYMHKYKSLIRNKIVVGFIGTIRYQSVLVNLIDASTELDNVVVLLAGDGPSCKYIKAYIDSNALESKIIMTGRYSIEDLNSIYESCDYVWAAYPNKDINVKYAISNKFFESIVFRKKVIVSENTMVGNSVNELEIGYTVDPYNVESIFVLLKSLSKEAYTANKVSFGKGLFWEDEEVELKSIYND